MLDDGRRQIGAFYLAGDMFGLEVGDEHDCHRPLSSDMFCSANHLALDDIIERDPSLFQLWSESGTKLLFQAPYQRVTERNKMRRLHSKFCMLITRIANGHLEK